jgi:CBS domain-containing protein
VKGGKSLWARATRGCHAWSRHVSVVLFAGAIFADSTPASAGATDIPTQASLLSLLQPPVSAGRDIWEKIGSVSALISGVLVAIIGAIATYVYNNRQGQAQARQADREVAVQRVQTVATFMPYLRSEDAREKEAALLAISALGDPELASNLARTFRDEGSVDALSRLAASPDESTAAVAQQSLDAIYELLRKSVVKVTGADDSGNERARGSGFAVDRGYVLTTDYVPADAASVEMEMTSGQRLGCEVVAVEPAHGLAVLHIDGQGPPPLRLAENTIAGEDELVLLGFGRSGWSTSVGRVVGMTQSPHSAGLALLRTSLRTEPGHGGAPVVNRAGNVVGILYAHDVQSAEALVLPVTAVREGIRALGLPIDLRRLGADA